MCRMIWLYPSPSLATFVDIYLSHREKKDWEKGKGGIQYRRVTGEEAQKDSI